MEKSLVSSTEQVSNEHLVTASWNPHISNSNLIAAGAVDHNLYLIDTRLIGGPKSNVWKIEGAHNGDVNTVKFNPFVPYWLASGGSDGVVKVWDIRYHKNAAVYLLFLLN